MASTVTSYWKENQKFLDIDFPDMVSKMLENKETDLEFSFKYDGVLGSVHWKKNRKKWSPDYIQISTKKEVLPQALPFSYEISQWLSSLGYKEAILIGELVGKKEIKKDGFLDLGETVSAIHSKPELIHFFILDILELDGLRTNINSLESLEKMLPGLPSPKFPRIHYARWKRGDVYTLRELWKEAQRENLEGLVARSPKRPNIRYRIKFRKTLDAVVFSVGNRKSELWNNAMVSYLRVAFMSQRGTYIISNSKVGTGFSLEKRREYFSWASSRKTSVSNFTSIYPTTTRKTLSEMELIVVPDRVIEFQVQRVRPSECIEFSYNTRTRTYTFIGFHRGINFDMGSLQRERPDKSPFNISDISILQVPSAPF